MLRTGLQIDLQKIEDSIENCQYQLDHARLEPAEKKRLAHKIKLMRLRIKKIRTESGIPKESH